MIEFKGYRIDETNLFNKRIKCTVEEVHLLTELCASLNPNEISASEFISKNPYFMSDKYLEDSIFIIVTISEDWTWGWDELGIKVSYIEFKDIAKLAFDGRGATNFSNANSNILKPLKQGTIVKAVRYNGDNPPFTWQGVYYGECNGKYLIDFNGTHCMVADIVEVVPTLTRKEAKQKVSELFANNGKNVTSQKIREIIDLIELDEGNKEVLNGNNI